MWVFRLPQSHSGSSQPLVCAIDNTVLQSGIAVRGPEAVRCRVQVETGNPYMLYKDTCNRKSNQQNLGTIKCSNLCTEIIEFTSPEETAVCNLASIALPRFVRSTNKLEARRVKLVGSLDAPNRHCPPLL